VNQIRRVIQARIDNLMRLAEAASNVGHAATIGQLRESYLMELFRELIPANLALSSGFISDATGQISPQLDFIVTLNSALPLIAMKDQTSIVPVESALLVAEIKSTLSLSALQQVERQNESLALMQPCGEMGQERFIIPTIVIAYESNVANDTLQKWMESNGNTVVCCVLNGDTFMKADGIRVFAKDGHQIKHHGVLAFIANFYSMLEDLNSMRDFKPNLHTYLTGRPTQNDGSS